VSIGESILINGQRYRCTSAEFGPQPGEITFHLECREGDAIQMVNLIFNTTENNNENDQ